MCFVQVCSDLEFRTLYRTSNTLMISMTLDAFWKNSMKDSCCRVVMASLSRMGFGVHVTENRHASMLVNVMKLMRLMVFMNIDMTLFRNNHGFTRVNAAHWLVLFCMKQSGDP